MDSHKPETNFLSRCLTLLSIQKSASAVTQSCTSKRVLNVLWSTKKGFVESDIIIIKKALRPSGL